MFALLSAAVCNGLWGNDSCGGYASSGSADQRDRMSNGSISGGVYSSMGDRSLTSNRVGRFGGGGESQTFWSSTGVGSSAGIPWGPGIGG